MRILEITGVCIVALLVVWFALFFRVRLLMIGGGTIRVQLRTSTMVPGRGWSTGVGRFVGDELRIYRIFSFAWSPKRVLNRHSLAVGERRLPMPGHWIILTCTSGALLIEVAMAETTVTGFSSWLEAGPPGEPGVLRPRRS
jgi:hypothetical protein